jgi:chromosome segregation ATPase
MDAKATDQPDEKPAYTTSKQVQAWFLGRSRDRWKKKAMELRVELKRLRQRVADVGVSRADWRKQVQTARQEIEQLRSQNTELQARLDQFAEETSKKRVGSPQSG